MFKLGCLSVILWLGLIAPCVKGDQDLENVSNIRAKNILVPATPSNLRVLYTLGQCVQLRWDSTFDDNSPIFRYILEFKNSISGTWEENRIYIPSNLRETQILGTKYLAATYQIRIRSENENGESDPSEPITITFIREPPTDVPQVIKVVPISQTTLRLTWQAPSQNNCSDDIFGFYVGYKQADSTYDSYIFKAISVSTEETKEYSLDLNDLKTDTKYSITIQAVNRFGLGPISNEVYQYTVVGGERPNHISCVAVTSQAIQVSWDNLPKRSENSYITGYKVVYAPSELWNDDNKKEFKTITSTNQTVLNGLNKFTFYTIQVLATTSSGDDVLSQPIECQTEVDIPDPITDIKVLVTSSDTIIVSWRPPKQPNGVIVQYTVYYSREGDATPVVTRVAPNKTMLEVSNLEKDNTYKFWITSSTIIGEGSASNLYHITTNDVRVVPATIANFDETFTISISDDVHLPCITIGTPTPDIIWRVNGDDFVPAQHVMQLPDGTLFIKGVTKDDSGVYTCIVHNVLGNDTITHTLTVNSPPQSPVLTISESTHNSLTLKLKPYEGDVGTLNGFTLHYKPEFGEWEKDDIDGDVETYLIPNLDCGRDYQLFATANNKFGSSEKSNILNIATKGSRPLLLDESNFIERNSYSVTLNLRVWSDEGCPIYYFIIENKQKDQDVWNLISNRAKPKIRYVILDLEPGTWYNIRVTAHNSAGFTVSEHEFVTLT